MILEVPLNVLSHLYLDTIHTKKEGGKPPLISKPYEYYAVSPKEVKAALIEFTAVAMSVLVAVLATEAIAVR